MKKMRFGFLLGGLFSAAVLSSCGVYSQGGLSNAGQQGAATGAVLGGVTGVLLDKSNKWRGGVLGAAIGGVLGGTLGQIANNAAQQAAQANQPVVYNSETGNQRVVATPQGETDNGCKKVETDFYKNGNLIEKKIQYVCPNQ